MRSTFATLLVLLIATTVLTTQSSSATAPDHGPSAFGQGAFSFFNGVRSEAWSFSFEAMANKNGQARGRATFDILDARTETQVVVKIDCLEVVGSFGINDAIMTGTVLHSDDPSYPKRSKVIFAAEDNSGFSTIRPDFITPIFVIEGFEGDCHDLGQPLTMFQQSPDAITIEP